MLPYAVCRQGASASALDVQEYLSKQFEIHTDELKVGGRHVA
jgi:hypothetical protein